MTKIYPEKQIVFVDGNYQTNSSSLNNADNGIGGRAIPVVNFI